MENEATFVAPEGVYSITEEHKPTLVQTYTVNANQSGHPTRLSTVQVKYPVAKSGTPGFAQLLVGNKEAKKVREDGVSLSSSDTPDEDPTSTQENALPNPQALFSHPTATKKKQISRPKHNIRTTSSTFITRVQTAEGGVKALHSKQGDATFIFYNCAKTFLWLEAGSKAKVCIDFVPLFTRNFLRNLSPELLFLHPLLATMLTPSPLHQTV